MKRRRKISTAILAALLLPAAVWSQEPEIAVELPGGVPLEMVWIEPGTFLMGVPFDEDGVRGIETPQHLVTLTKGFYLGKFEVTQAQWETIVGTKPWEEISDAACPDCAVTWISWEEVQQFVQELNLTSDDSILYRLPTEAEWEYAARAGTTTAWSFGNDYMSVQDNRSLWDYAWYGGNTCVGDRSECFPHEGGLKLPNPWGLYDMHGNVWEWVENLWIGRYSEAPQIDPVNNAISDLDSVPDRIIRGGSITTPPNSTRSGARNFSFQNEASPNLGFRLVASPTIETQVAPTSWGMLKAAHQASTP